MHFSHLNDGSGTKATKLAIVAGLHVLLGYGIIHSINTRHVQMPKTVEDVLVMIQPDIPKEPPPPPPEPPKPMPKMAPPEIVAPKIEVDVPPPQDAPQIQTAPEPSPEPAPPQSQVQADAPPAQPSQNTGAMRSAVLVDPNGCAKPDYPAADARDGHTGTVTLALLIGPDGKVTSSRVEKSSGFRGLDKAAVNALSLCRFKPAMNNGVPEAGWAQLAYVWNLED